MIDFLFITAILPIYFFNNLAIAFEAIIFGGNVQGRFILPIFDNSYLMMGIGILLWFMFLYGFYKFFIKKLAYFIGKKFIKKS